MVIFRKNKFVYKLYAWLPILFLLFSVLNEFDLNFLPIEYFTLKEYNRFDYLLVFIAGLVNDTVIGTPLGLSSFSYIFVCIFSVYLRNITIRPNLIKDWIYFLFVITLINSMNYLILFFFFSYDLNIMFYVINNLFTFLLYIPMTLIFNNYLKTIND